MARGCALIDSRLDTAKICSDGRVHVDHAQLPAVFGGEKTFSHGLDPKRTSLVAPHMSALALRGRAEFERPLPACSIMCYGVRHTCSRKKSADHGVRRTT